MGKVFKFIGDSPNCLNANLFPHIKEVDIKSTVNNLIDTLLHASSIFGPDSTLVLCHPIFLLSLEVSRLTLVAWTASNNPKMTSIKQTE